MKVLITICAFNEQLTVANVVAPLVDRSFEVVVIDDGSKDLTRHEALSAGARVLTHVKNFGQGAAIASAMELCLAEHWDAIVTVDGDGQHDSSSVVSIMEAWLADPATEVFLGSRTLGEASNIPISRKLLLKLATLFTKITTGLDLTDTHNGLRVLSRNACSKLVLKQARMAHASEILREIRLKRLTWREWPVKIHYTPYSKEKGQRTFSGALQILWDLLVRGR
jgi:glycosyltransferase involved in cell wall biosynthesis